MRLYLTILLALFSSLVFAQKPNEESLKQSVSAFNNALIHKDSVGLKQLLNDNLNYGHSNGWIQTKRDLINDLFNGKITDNKINSTAETVSIDGNTAWVRSATDLDVIMEGNPMQFKLNALQVWTWENKHWVLFARQSVKM